MTGAGTLSWTQTAARPPPAETLRSSISAIGSLMEAGGGCASAGSSPSPGGYQQPPARLPAREALQGALPAAPPGSGSTNRWRRRSAHPDRGGANQVEMRIWQSTRGRRLGVYIGDPSGTIAGTNRVEAFRGSGRRRHLRLAGSRGRCASWSGGRSAKANRQPRSAGSPPGSHNPGRLPVGLGRASAPQSAGSPPGSGASAKRRPPG
jgi:hypothetical protein